jgi:hypothetical protein
MDREQEEAVQRITERYLAELRAGQQPTVGDYVARYPQYANDIADFVAYYHAFEADVSETMMPAPLSELSRYALQRALERVSGRRRRKIRAAEKENLAEKRLRLKVAEERAGYPIEEE